MLCGSFMRQYPPNRVNLILLPTHILHAPNCKSRSQKAPSWVPWMIWDLEVETIFGQVWAHVMVLWGKNFYELAAVTVVTYVCCCFIFKFVCSYETGIIEFICSLTVLFCSFNGEYLEWASTSSLQPPRFPHGWLTFSSSLGYLHCDWEHSNQVLGTLGGLSLEFLWNLVWGLGCKPYCGE